MTPYIDQNIVVELPPEFHKEFVNIANAIIKLAIQDEKAESESFSISSYDTLFDSIPILIDKIQGYKTENIVSLKSIILEKTTHRREGYYETRILFSLCFRVEVTLYPYVGTADMLLTEAELYDIKRGRHNMLREDFRKPVII